MRGDGRFGAHLEHTRAFGRCAARGGQSSGGRGEARVSELRQDALTGRWTIVAPERDRRPLGFSPSPASITFEDRADCPFCPGNEDRTPPEVYRYPAAGPWLVRVVPNRFPALSIPEGETGAHPLDAPWPYVGTTGFGGHEVIIETPVHGQGLADFDDDQAAAVIEACRARIAAWRADGRVAAVVLFRNWGLLSGASLEHAHTQLIAMADVPPALAAIAARFDKFRAEHGECLLCTSALADEAGGRDVIADAHVRAQVPWASQSPYLVRVSPKHCDGGLEADDAETARSLGVTLREVARAYRTLLGDPAFNIIVRTVPFGTAHFHWHVDMMPRYACVAGFEVGAGVDICSVDPDVAAARLREALGG
jgi:UDPglucose--hexose-1-phosphate uridylyltransferase